MESNSEWDCLPTHLLDSILDKLTPYTDYLGFGAVCTNWQSAAASHQDRRHILEHHESQIPMLIMTTNDYHNLEDKTDGVYALHSVSRAKTHHSFRLKNMPNPSDYTVKKSTRSCGSSLGWLAYMDIESHKVTLLNPFTGHTVDLPPVTGPDALIFFGGVDILGSLIYFGGVDILGLGCDPYYFIHGHKVVLSADPYMFPNDFEALVIKIVQHEGSTLVGHYKSGDDAWVLHMAETTLFSDVVYHKGQFVAVPKQSANGEIGLINVLQPGGNERIISISTPNFESMAFLSGSPPSNVFDYASHLVESSRGDLLLVRRICDLSPSFNFQVFKLMGAFGDPQLQWVEIDSLEENDALFLGGNATMSAVPTLNFPGCHPNSIYFLHFKRTVEVFSFREGRIITSYYLSHLEHMQSEIWILPTMV